MQKRPSDIEALIESLSDLQKEVEIENVLNTALAEPMSTQERLAQIDQHMEAFKRFGLLGRNDSRDLHLLLSIGRTYERFSHYEKACETYQTALLLAELLKEAETCATLLSRIGRVFVTVRSVGGGVSGL
ncbi:MAG: hypothetical protein QGG64_18275 [Candidatus Latescibacteria bacterium]|jgi:hypothetical protein|nr:hypothetical protein [Candidatus Latescibacterota bacterium]